MVDDRSVTLEPGLTAPARTFVFIHETMEGGQGEGGARMRSSDDDQ